MIVVKMMGNLGNQMFIYAMARSLQLRYHDDLVIDLSGLKRHYYTANYKLDHFALPEGISYSLEGMSPASRVKYELSSRIFHLEHFYYRKTHDDLVIPKEVCLRWFRRGCYYCTNRPYFDYPESRSRNKYVYGYFQAEQYFHPYRDRIRAELRVTDPVSETDRALMASMAACASVGVSIRAQKAPENAKVADNVKLGFISREYYYEGMRRMAQIVKDPVFYIFADDLDAVKEQFDFPYPVVYVDPADSAAGMRLLYNCKHFVIANSTFSWWGAYLGDFEGKRIVMPEPWDRNGEPRECIFLPDAIRIPCSFED